MDGTVARVESEAAALGHLIDANQQLSTCRDLLGVMSVVRTAARRLTGADGATFVLREGDLCHYADEDAIAPLWKGRRFPMHACISGWVMSRRTAAEIEDVYEDDRIPIDAYRPTFVKSMAMVPIRTLDPIGTIGNYWADRHRVTPEELRRLQSLADITSIALENVRFYDDLDRKVRQLERLVRGRDEFLSVTAHELRTPLSALQLQLQSLESVIDEHQVDARVSERLRRACETVARIGTLVDGLLDVSRISVDRIHLRRQWIDLGSVARSVCDRFRRQAERVECTLTVTTHGPTTGAWDPERVDQVFANLVSNAIKYGAGEPVEVSLTGSETLVRIAVRDHGESIPATDLDRVFDRFERTVSVRNYGGLGLGLYVVRQVARAHGGVAWVECPADGGNSFIVDLPRAP